MKTSIIIMILLLMTGCTLHQKSTLSKIEITQGVDDLMDEVYKFSLKSEAYALQHGRKLTINEVKYAKSIGIQYPEKVRVLFTENFPVPQNKEVLKGFKDLGFDSILVAGVTYGYGIFIKPYWLVSKEYVLAHELIHVRQVEQAKNFKIQIRNYLIQAFSYEYFEMPYENEAYQETENFKGFDLEGKK